MGKPRSRQPAHARPVRRSLVELTAAAVSSAARDGERVTSPTPMATFFVKAGETAAENSDQLTTSIAVAPPAAGHADASLTIGVGSKIICADCAPLCNCAPFQSVLFQRVAAPAP